MLEALAPGPTCCNREVMAEEPGSWSSVTPVKSLSFPGWFPQPPAVLISFLSTEMPISPPSSCIPGDAPFSNPVIISSLAGEDE